MIQSAHDIESMEIIHQLETLLADDYPTAKSQLQRHISNSSSLQKRRNSRIAKTTSAGSSPQNYQRRRHTTSQTIPRQRRAVYQQCLQTPPTPQLLDIARPVSWHPSSIAYQHLLPSYNTTHFTHGMPTPMTQPSLYNPEDPSGFYQQSADYNICGNLELDTTTQGSYFNAGYNQQQGSAVFSPVLCPTSTHITLTAPATPDFLPPLTVNDLPQRPALLRTDSKELIGMGLYDGPDRNSWTLDNFMDGENTTRPISLGKGLKLEETWEPPEEEDKTDDEEETAAEEEEEETIQQQLEQVINEVPQLPSMEAINQSFFFNTQNVLDASSGFGQHMMMPSFSMIL